MTEFILKSQGHFHFNLKLGYNFKTPFTIMLQLISLNQCLT